MNERTYTLKEVAAALCPDTPAEVINKTSRQIRHWTLMNLLSPEGEKHTGTGISRRYSPTEIRKAAVLVELSRWRLPMTVLADTFEIGFEDYVGGPEWNTAVEGQVNVFLELTWSEEVTGWKFSVNEPQLRMLRSPAAGQYEENDREVLPWRPPVSAIVVNITRLFKALDL